MKFRDRVEIILDFGDFRESQKTEVKKSQKK